MKKMSIFDYMNFSDGCQDVKFVTHAKKYTKEQTIAKCIAENDWKFLPKSCNGNLLRKPIIGDITRRAVRWYVYIREPENCDGNNEGGGSFPV